MTVLQAVNEENLWIEVRPDSPFRHRGETAAREGNLLPALFLDRDGVVVEEVNYLSSPEDVALEAGVASQIAEANAAGIPVVLVTNQSGLARGYFEWADFAAVQERLHALLTAQGARLDMVLACPYHRDGQRFVHANHPFRKPNPGMLLEAAGTLQLDLEKSVMVGDSLSDIQAAFNAGLRTAAHVLTGHGDGQRPLLEDWCAEQPGFTVLRLKGLEALSLRDCFGSR
ncbi:D-glycero-alpha-D-manno-heptose-1,7-bisphosphate 7-phosphatase [Kiloniella sp. b19]|uniref:D-glycero-alpha-D-manno-heptose-1,7-bisphosphate 7-phosphatase n=1 Tax=Kiloniella sp. GXU_MW_B19 TaxID=3141326 RepID=UPI0031D6BB50